MRLCWLAICDINVIIIFDLPCPGQNNEKLITSERGKKTCYTYSLCVCVCFCTCVCVCCLDHRKGPVKPEVLPIHWSGRRSNRRLQRNNSLSPNNPLLNLVNSGDCSLPQCSGGRKGHIRTPDRHPAESRSGRKFR